MAPSTPSILYMASTIGETLTPLMMTTEKFASAAARKLLFKAEYHCF